jgi:uncharacterized membrane protein YqiK
MTIISLLTPAIIILAALLVFGLAFARMYKRSTREVSLVKTGTGGRRVIIDGGTLVVPVLHEITRINMKTTLLQVSRNGASALITKDRMRVDVGCEFYVTVEATEEGIARAAQTLGARTFDERALREMIEGKLVDALRSVAAGMTLDELHENRSNFVQQVQQTVTEELKKNGLQLESVALTALDQTPLDNLDENNVFNATGLQIQAERIAESRKRRAQIEAEAQVSVAQSNQQAAVRTYQIQVEQEQRRVEQSVAMQDLKGREEAERARAAEAAAQAAEAAKIERTKAIEIAEQDRRIAIADKSRAESEARATADEARAKAIQATESVETARQVAEAERRRRIEIIEAEKQAETVATSVRVAARTEREAAVDRAAAMRELAEAEAEKALIAARAEADAVSLRAQAEKALKLAEAEGNRALFDSENSLSPGIIDFRIAQKRLEVLPSLLEQMVKPAERIDRITINRIDGVMGGPGAASGAGGGEGSSQNVVALAFDQIRQNAVALPALQAIGQAVGLDVSRGVESIVESQAQLAAGGSPTPSHPASLTATPRSLPAREG